MATLKLEFNCLCLFVPDPENKAVHVLMPTSGGHNGHAGHQGHEEDHKHVVRMLHRSFEGEERRTGRDMEGWALVLGAQPGNAEVTLPAGAGDGELPNLSDITGDKVHRALVGTHPGNRVAARITLRSGKVARMASEARWQIGKRAFRLAHQVTWLMDVPPKLEWERLNGGPQVNPPLESLKALEPEDNLSYRLRIFHVTKDALPPRGGMLRPKVMGDHYRAFYSLLGNDTPEEGLLPGIEEKHVFTVMCGGARGTLRPVAGHE